MLHESFSGAFEAVGEAKFYLSLLALVGARSEEQVKALDASLMQVRAVTWVMAGLLGRGEHADAGASKPLGRGQGANCALLHQLSGQQHALGHVCAG